MEGYFDNSVNNFFPYLMDAHLYNYVFPKIHESALYACSGSGMDLTQFMEFSTNHFKGEIAKAPFELCELGDLYGDTRALNKGLIL